MLQLDRLPPEILSIIFQNLGSQFFQQDVSRLHVSKWWYSLAHPVLHEHVCLTTDSAARFVAACSQRASLLGSIRTHMRRVTLILRGFDNRNDSTQGTIDSPDSSTSPTAPRDPQYAWAVELNANLGKIASILQSCQVLHSLVLDGRPGFHGPQWDLERQYHLSQRPVTDLLSVGHLTNLEIDMAGTDLLHRRDDADVHICGAIHALLPKLRRLRCRLARVCPLLLGRESCIITSNGTDVIMLKPSHPSPLESLESIVVNLSLFDSTGSATSYRYPRRCQQTGSDNFSFLESHMEDTARELVLRMKTPRVVRIISHMFPSLELQSFDAIKVRRMKLAPDAPWDADGEVIDGSEGDEDDTEDLFDSDSDSGNFLTAE